MPQCYVEMCGNYYEKTKGAKEIIYHMLPGDPVLAAKWVRACGKKEHKLPYYARVCSNHFSEKCYQRDLQHELLGLPLRRKLKPGVVPDKNLPKHHKQKIKENIGSKIIDISRTKQHILSPADKSATSEINRNTESRTNNETKTKTASMLDIKLKKGIIGIGSSKCMLPRPKVANVAPKAIIIDSSPEISEIEIIAQNSIVTTPKNSSTKIFNFNMPHNKSKKKSNEYGDHSYHPPNTEVLREKEDKDRSSKVNNKMNRIPIRSSYRIAKKKSIESLSDSFTEKVNSKGHTCNKPEKFTDKLKFMAKLQLRFQRRENFVLLPKYDLEASLQKVVKEECFSNRSKNFENAENKGPNVNILVNTLF